MNIKVQITGVCGLSRVSASDLRVLAAAERSATSTPQSSAGGHDHGAAGHAGGHRCVPKHRAFLEFEEGHPDVTVSDDGVDFSKNHDNKTFGYFIFHNEILILRKVQGNDPVPSASIVTTNIIEMERAVPGHGEVNPAFVSSDYDPAMERVNTVLRLPGGVATARNVDFKKVFTFEPMMGPSVYSGSFAQTVDIDLNVPDSEEWVLERRPQGEPETTPQPMLTFKGKGNSFTILFGNAPMDDIVGVKDHADDEIDHHFALLYGLLANPPVCRSLPTRVSARNLDVKLGGTNCPPVVLGP